MRASVWVLLLLAPGADATAPPKWTESDFKALVDTCIGSSGSGYLAAAAKLDDSRESGRAITDLTLNGKTWEERMTARILRARRAYPWHVPGRPRPYTTGIAAIKRAKPPERRPGEGEVPALNASHQLPYPRPHCIESHKRQLGRRLFGGVVVCVEFLWKHKETTQAQRLYAVKCLVRGSSLQYWQAMGYDLKNTHPYIKYDRWYFHDLGEVLMHVLKQEEDAYVARELQRVLVMIPDERVLERVRQQAASKDLAESVRQRFAEVVPLMEQYLNRLKAKSSGTTQPTR